MEDTPSLGRGCSGLGGRMDALGLGEGFRMLRAWGEDEGCSGLGAGWRMLQAWGQDAGCFGLGERMEDAPGLGRRYRIHQAWGKDGGCSRLGGRMQPLYPRPAWHPSAKLVTSVPQKCPKTPRSPNTLRSVPWEGWPRQHLWRKAHFHLNGRALLPLSLEPGR